MRGNRDEIVASVMADCLAEASLTGSLLCAFDETGKVEEAATQAGLVCQTWSRNELPWPPEAAADNVALRLPKGREALLMSLHAVLSRATPGARVFVFGANDEGIRSADKPLSGWLEDLYALETKRHSRVWSGTLAKDAGPFRSKLSDWEEALEIDAPGGPLRLISLPGLFAHGRLDPGTRLLLEWLEELPRPKPGARMLDFGCGAGTISLAFARRCEDAEIHCVDRDALAIHAAQLNLPNASLHLGDGWSAVPEALRFDLIASNPPLHSGKDQDLRGLVQLIEGSRRRLTKRGRLALVTQRPLPVGSLLDERFAHVDVARESRSFRVWVASGLKRREG
ncbi:MAG: class I SAM-dependent methyltransferase [Deltaproteobacteria bacterium]|nr:class I SAM-dependent methyltransferase [Deltaproteobacteria bacterium]MBW2393226.1 class I SAM-dependent methyltransferase [Deltaproteobacteria bacterium]